LRAVVGPEFDTLCLDVHSMTSCELTSSFHCWSCDYLCVAVIHLPTKLMQIALYNMEFYCILQAILY